MGYWEDRQATTQDKLTQKNVKQVEAQMRKYYASTMEKILGQFEKTYNKVFSSIEDGREPTPADLYKLDTYWQQQAQLTDELIKLGDKQAALLSKRFTEQYIAIYEALAIPGEATFNTIDKALATEMINQVWCADGETWKARIWKNTNKLKQELNQGLIDCLVAGRKTTDLKKVLQERFGVSYSRADTLVRTEMAHIQTQAAAKRYEDAGLEKYRIRGNEDDTCGTNHSGGRDCHDEDGNTYFYREMKVGVNAPPFHPNCRCCIIPVVD